MVNLIMTFGIPFQDKNLNLPVSIHNFQLKMIKFQYLSYSTSDAVIIK